MKKGSYYSITERGDFAFTTTGDIFLDLFLASVLAEITLKSANLFLTKL